MAQVDMFLKIDGIKGESADDKHKDEIDILSFSWGMANQGTTHTGTGGGAGKVAVQDITVTKHLDKSTPNAMLFCCNGKHIGQAVLTVRKAGENPLEYLKITMEDVLIAAINDSGSGDVRPAENLTLNFGQVKVEYTPQKKDGTGDAPVTMGWNIAANVKK